jgi:DNA-binding NarL/FixJ family response regulator
MDQGRTKISALSEARKWTEEEDQRLLSLKKAGKSVAMIAKALNRTESSVTSRITVLNRQ